MPTTALSGQDTIKINRRILVDFADGDVGQLTFPNDIVGVKTGKNDNALFGYNSTGRQAELALRILRGSADDKYLNNLINMMLNNFAGFVLVNGEFVKVLGDGAGNITSDTYVASGGVPNKAVEATSNAEGSTDQSISIYRFKFATCVRLIT